jgi:hypothetical protein
MTTTFHELAVEAAKATPPVTVAGLSLWGVTLHEWVLILTAVYTVLQIGFLLRDKLLHRKDNHDSKH